MLLVSAIIPALVLYLLYLYVALLRRFFTVKAKLPVLGLKGSLGNLSGKRRKLAMLGVLFFLISFAAQIVGDLYAPSMLMVFNYEEAAWGQNPNATRFNESDILSDDILEQVVQRGGLKLSAEQLAGYLTLSTPLDAEKLDVTKESNLKISTEFRVHCSEMVSLHHTTPKMVLNILADVYWDEYYPPWEPPVSRLRAIRNGYFPPSEPPQHIVLPCIFDFIRDLLIVISGELQMQYHQIIYKEVFLCLRRQKSEAFSNFWEKI